MNNQLDVGQIYEEFRNPLKAFISRRISDPALAEDLLHDVFLKIHDQIGSLKEQEKLPAWIYQITRNAIIDSSRKQRHFPVEHFAEIATERSQINEISESLVPVIQRMVKRLPDKYREALVLADYRGIKQAEIAERFGISLSAAKSRVQRARALLKNLLLQCCHFEFDRYGTVFDYHAKNCSQCCDGPNQKESC
jgi:RNA polymerase sigma-70 factor (ECF subfamily)